MSTPIRRSRSSGQPSNRRIRNTAGFDTSDAVDRQEGSDARSVVAVTVQAGSVTVRRMADRLPESGALRRVNIRRGWKIAGVGLFLTAVGAAGGVYCSVNLVRLAFSLDRDPPWEVPLLMVMTTFMTLILRRGSQLKTIAFRYFAQPVPLPESGKAFVLYLRSFKEDSHRGAAEELRVQPALLDLSPLGVLYALLTSGKSAEESLVTCFRDMKPVIAVGSPGEMVPPAAGAQRVYLKKDRGKSRCATSWLAPGSWSS
ncbi:hypothetical protein ACFV4N_32925 [Actinosynnema sp. NPDC059797]